MVESPPKKSHLSREIQLEIRYPPGDTLHVALLKGTFQSMIFRLSLSVGRLLVSRRVDFSHFGGRIGLTTYSATKQIIVNVLWGEWKINISPSLLSMKTWNFQCFTIIFHHHIFSSSLWIQSPCQMMIGVYNHLLRKVLRFHYHSQKVIGSLGHHSMNIGTFQYINIKPFII